MPETIAFLEEYARVISAPVHTRTSVTAVRRDGDGYVVRTNSNVWQCESVVLANGACSIPNIPAIASTVPAGIDTLTAFEYRNPDQLANSGVMVVGASATGTQIADEVHRSGRPVTISVGEHVRVPRVYRERDIQWWMDASGVMDEDYTEVDDLTRARNVPSLQLAGSPERKTVDLNSLTDNGVKLIGRLAAINDNTAQFSGALPNLCKLADLKMNRLLKTIDEWIIENGLESSTAPQHRFDATRVDASPPLGMDLIRTGIRTIIWATGFRPDFSLLEVDVFDRKGRVRHDGGIVDSAGLYLMGLPFLRRRKSSLIDGAGDDARDLSAHLAAYLDNRPA